MKIEVSNGEILDKMSILEIKMEKIKDENKFANIKKEYEYLKEISQQLSYDNQSYLLLLDINNELWNIEDDIRDKERNAEFDTEFIKLARSVYVTNDKRCMVKRQINIDSKSNFIEEKSYKSYN